MSDSLLLTTPTCSRFTPKQVARFFFKPLLDDNENPTDCHVCKACEKYGKQAPGKGFSNIVSHVRKQHPTYEREMANASPAATGSLTPWVSQKASNRFGWKEWIIKTGLPLSFCEQEQIRRYMNFEPVSVDTLRHNIESVTREVESIIGAEMSDTFGLILDGWSNGLIQVPKTSNLQYGSEHYLAVFGCYIAGGENCYPLLSMAPILQEPDGDHSAGTHLRAIETFLPFLRLANLIGVPLDGCASHRLNLAVKTILAPHEADLEAVQSVMKKLRTLNGAGKLRLMTPLRPVLRQATRWGSSYKMLDRFFELRGFISLEDEELAELMSSPASHRKLKALLEELADYQSVTMALQGTDIDLLGARDLHDGLIEKKPSMKPYIGSSANIIHSPAFESGCCKILDGSVDTLTRSERQALRPLLRCENRVENDQGEAAGVGFAERILKRRKMTVPATSYPLVWAIPPTSNLVERLFRTARAMLGRERQAFTPLAVEMILFRKTNATYWDARIVDRCVQ